MPYYISDSAEGCSGWATIKEDGEVMGCHTTKQDAIDQALAIARAEGSEFLGERAMPGSLNVGNFVSWKEAGETYYGRIIEIVTAGAVAVPGSGVEIQGTYFDPAAMVQMWEQIDGEWTESQLFLGLKFSQLSRFAMPIDDSIPFDREPEDEDMDEDMDSLDDEVQIVLEEEDDSDIEDVRQVDLTPPAYMRAAARQGIRYYEEGLGGDGLVERTIREARAMAEGNVTSDKWVRIRAWVARHLDDLDAADARPGAEGYPSPGVVAHLLWGSGPSKARARRVLDYAERIVARLEEENRARLSVETRNMAKIETRTNSTKFEVREAPDGNGMTFTGYAAVFNSASEPLPFREKIAPGAFRRSLRARNDIKLLWNHDTGIVLGSTRAGTLRLEEDSVGLRVSADLPDTQAGRDAAYLIRRGDIDSMSFGFSVPPGGDEWSPDGTERTLKSVRLFEASIVAVPAYSATAGTTSVRNLDIIAKRAQVDADALADAMIKIESGENLSADEANLLNSVVDTLTEKIQDKVDEAQADAELSPEMLALKKKKLEQLLKGI